MPDTYVRLATVDDAAGVAAVYAPYVRDTTISFEKTPPTTDEMAARIAAVLDRHVWLVACRGSDIIGYAYGSTHRPRAAYRWSVETTVYLQASSHRRGIARRLYDALFALLVRQGYVNAFAGIALPNPASVALHEAIGFVPIGVFPGIGHKNDAWHDVSWWSRRLRECPEPPAEPLQLQSLDAAEIQTVLDLA